MNKTSSTILLDNILEDMWITKKIKIEKTQITRTLLGNCELWFAYNQIVDWQMTIESALILGHEFRAQDWEKRSINRTIDFEKANCAILLIFVTFPPELLAPSVRVWELGRRGDHSFAVVLFRTTIRKGRRRGKFRWRLSFYARQREADK